MTTCRGCSRDTALFRWCLGLLALLLPACWQPGGPVRGCVQFEERTLSRAGLSALQIRAAVGLHVRVRRGETAVGEGVTGADGCFAVPIAAASGPLVVELRAVAAAEGGRPILGVGHADSRQPPTYWHWTSAGDPTCDAPAIALSPAASGGSQLAPWILRESCGSGAIAAFMAAHEAMRYFDPRLSPLDGQPLPSLALRWSPGIRGDCSACFFAGPGEGVTIEGAAFDTRMELSGRSDTPSHWAPSTLAHEVGHWVMHAYSRRPSEDGLHVLGLPASPGLAYSEGWATAFGQRVLGRQGGAEFEPIYVTMQQSHVLWANLSALESTFGSIDLPVPEGGVTQPLSEFVVASALWRIWMKDGSLPSPSLGLGDAGMLRLLRSQRLRGGLDRGYPGPDLLDAIDACVCTGQGSTAELARVLAPLRYPWDGLAQCD